MKRVDFMYCNGKGVITYITNDIKYQIILGGVEK
jgi:hypothetical protein